MKELILISIALFGGYSIRKTEIIEVEKIVFLEYEIDTCYVDDIGLVRMTIDDLESQIDVQEIDVDFCEKHK